MAIIAKETSSTFRPAPAGVSMGVCCDVVDMGMQKVSYPGQPDSMKHKIRIVWQLADVDPELGKRPIVSQRYTLSLHEKAALRRDLESWRGRAFTPEERAGFDVEKVLGVQAMLNIVHREGNKGGTFANVSAIMPTPKGTPKISIDGYVREKDRPKDGPDAPGAESEEFQATDDDVPF